MPPPVSLFSALREDYEFEAHNSMFEWCVWLNQMVAKHGWPRLRLKRVRCSAAKAAVACMPRALAKVAIILGCENQKLDEKPFKKLWRPRKPTKRDDSEWIEYDDDPDLYEKMYDYCDGDVAAEEEVSSKLPDLSPEEARIYFADFRINLRGVRIDVPFVHAALRLNRQLTRSLSSELCELTDGYVMAATEGERIIRHLARTGLHMPNMQAETVEDTLDRDDLTDHQRRVLEIRAEGNRSSVTKYEAFEAVRDGDVVRCMYLYYGANAHGRWAGKNPQPQNFPRGDAKGEDGEKKGPLMERMVAAIKRARHFDELREGFYVEQSEVPGDPRSRRFKVAAPPAEVLSTALRGAFIPREGKVFGVGDYSAVECRMLFVMAGDEVGLSLYRNDQDVYRHMGSDIFGKPPEELDEAFERMMGKTTVLGCGYGMGWIKFKLTCKRAYGMRIDDALCKKSVYGYRKKFRKVERFWYDLEEAAKRCITRRRTVECGMVEFRMRGADLAIRLPSGREIFHRQARVTRDDQIVYVCNKGFLNSTWGGTICEYVVSGACRDMLADAIVKMEFEIPEINVAMHSHDEGVAEGEPGVVGKLVGQAMEDMPWWAREIGFPMKVETWEGPVYHK